MDSEQKLEKGDALKKLSSNVYVKSVDTLKDGIAVKGYDMNQGLDYQKVFASYINTGFQATAIGQSIECINSMINYRLSDDPIAEDEQE